ncbi:MAG: response regulator [Myxococcales bacterium]|nr:response regulator [Myxococcales bacterium]MCB9708003.1 response regulator [Myxococcales bacterium]
MNADPPNIFFDRLVQALSVPVVAAMSDGRIVPNKAAQAVLGKRCPKSMLETASLITGIPTQSRALQTVLNAGSEGRQATELLSSGRQGAEFPWQAISLPVQSGWQLWLVPTELRHAAQVEARAALADTTMNVCHETGNALTAIMGWAELGLRVPNLAYDAKQAFLHIQTGVHAAKTMTRAILEVSTKHAHVTTNIDATEVLEQLLALLEPAAKRAQVMLHKDIESGLHIRAGRADFWTAVWNVAKNGIEALPSSGTLRVCAHAASDHVLIAIEDNGPGMSADVQHALFSPYFSTKSGGTGLGLTLVKEAIARMRGNIEVSSALGRGSRFCLKIPRAVQDLEGATSGIRRSHVPMEAQILLVEDDASLGEMMVTALSLHGARVTLAKTAKDALALDEPFDLALLDVLLPDMRGDHLLQKLRSTRMVDKAILMSGDVSPGPELENARSEVWLRKPFELDTLIRLVREQLGMETAGSDHASALRTTG